MQQYHSESPIQAARSRFPNGLLQAEHCLRFDVSALLLGRYLAESEPDGPLVELGTGCGAASLQALLLWPSLKNCGLKICGLEILAPQAACARENAYRLGLDNFQVITGDLRDRALLRGLRMQYGAGEQRQFATVFCNPPWLAEKTGRPSPHAPKNTAARGKDGQLADFFKAADYLLGHKGSLYCIVAAAELTRALSSLPPRLQAAKLRLVHQNQRKPAVFALIRAVKKKKAVLEIEQPWFIDQM